MSHTDSRQPHSTGRHRNEPAPAGSGSTAVGAADSPSSGDIAGRGSTQIADRVVERIAAAAVDEVAGAGGLARRVLGVTLGHESLDNDARTTARVDGGLVLVDVAMSVLYPASVRQTAARVRDRVTDRVSSLTGLRVSSVDIEVSRLVPPPTTARTVL